PEAEQRLLLDGGLAVRTVVRQHGCELTTSADVVWEGGRAWCRLRATGQSPRAGWLAVAVRPANPEGVSFVHTVARARGGRARLVSGPQPVHLDRARARVCLSEYRRGDVLPELAGASERSEIFCDIGLATAAALYRLEPGRPAEVVARVPLDEAPG